MKVIVAHPAQQHSYRLATALKKAGYLNKYITTVYLKDKSLTRTFIPLMPSKFRRRAEERVCQDLEDSDVIQFCEFEGLVRLLTPNVPFLKKYYNKIKYHLADRFAKKVARYVIKNNVDAVVTYDDCSPLLFEILKDRAPQIVRILDVSAANRLYMKTIYEQDLILAPSFASRLKKECRFIWDFNILDRCERELNVSELFFIPSTFVAGSLEFSGITKQRMITCPYGVDGSKFFQKEYKNYHKEPIKFVYIGGVKELKGIYYLLEAFKKIPKEIASLLVIGDIGDNQDIVQYRKANIIFSGRILHKEIPNVLSSQDVFMFTSLGDSFSLSALEAAACGLPLIVTENTGMKDCILDGKEGFIIPIQSVDAIIEKIYWFFKHPEEIQIMGKAARKMAKKYSWERYYENVQNTISAMVIE